MKCNAAIMKYRDHPHSSGGQILMPVMCGGEVERLFSTTAGQYFYPVGACNKCGLVYHMEVKEGMRDD